LDFHLPIEVKSSMENNIRIDLSQHPPLTPQVYIIGVGPGDPDLLTVKGQRIIAAADVMLTH
jgi:precorrin-4/cobalt-precorrin-4 C11-methyltransferase